MYGFNHNSVKLHYSFANLLVRFYLFIYFVLYDWYKQINGRDVACDILESGCLFAACCTCSVDNNFMLMAKGNTACFVLMLIAKN